jgi:hypothetical protein
MHLFKDEAAGNAVVGPSDPLNIIVWRREG